MENLGIDSKLLIAQLINFGLFFFVFKKYLAKPFLKFIKAEKEGTEEREKILAKTKVMEEKLLEKEKAMKAAIKKETDERIAEAKSAAQKVKAQLVEEAQREIEDMKAKAKRQLEQERAEIERQAKQRVNDLSFVIVQSALKDVLTSDMKKKISEAIVTNSAKSIRLHEN